MYHCEGFFVYYNPPVMLHAHLAGKWWSHSFHGTYILMPCQEEKKEGGNFSATCK